MYAHYETLRKLDSVIISKVEFDNTIVWNEHLNHFKSLRKLKPDNPKKPPAKEEDENEKKAGGQ